MRGKAERRELAYSTHFNAVLNGRIDVAADNSTWGKTGVRMNMVTSLAHELVHCLQGQHHGFIPFNITKKLPFSKKEG